MITHTHGTLTIHFGTAHESFVPRQFTTLQSQSALCAQPQFVGTGLTRLITLTQTHSTIGHTVTRTFAESYSPYAYEGDYLVTDEPLIGLGVATADCLPLILYDTRTYAIAAIHAGWRGSVNGIALNALTHLQTTYGSHVDDIVVYFGPSARRCCYEVQDDFVTIVGKDAPGLEKRGGFFFDTCTYNAAALITAGVRPTALNYDYALCTLCNTQFCSYRRDGAASLRQMTIAYLK